jgi:hypothetical protein
LDVLTLATWSAAAQLGLLKVKLDEYSERLDCAVLIFSCVFESGRNRILHLPLV